MFALLSPLSKYLKLKSVRIYDGVFILHSKITVCILLACTIIISAKQYFGDPIDCIADTENKNFINNFCWTFGTYILEYNAIPMNSNSATIMTNDEKTNYNHKRTSLNDLPGYLYHIQTDHEMRFINPINIDRELIDYGIGPEKMTSKRLYFRYYQWIVLILLLQALSFFLPSFLWKFWEGGRLQQLCGDLGSAIVSEEWNKKRKDLLVHYFTTNQYKDIHMCYALKYAFCEILNCAVCILNIFLMNVFFSEFWINYAPALNMITSYDWNKWNRVTSKIFPKIAKCEFLYYGSSGSVQKLDALCLLPLNILNEKLFAFLWLWYLFLIIISGINILYRIFLVFNRKFRLQILRSQLRTCETYKIYKIFNNMNFGDWFLLYKVGNNVNPIIFTDLIELLSTNNKNDNKISNDDRLV